MNETYAHMCRDEHVQIGHNDSTQERCPVCRERDKVDFLLALLDDLNLRACYVISDNPTAALEILTGIGETVRATLKEFEGEKAVKESVEQPATKRPAPRKAPKPEQRRRRSDSKGPKNTRN